MTNRERRGLWIKDYIDDIDDPVICNNLTPSAIAFRNFLWKLAKRLDLHSGPNRLPHNPRETYDGTKQCKRGCYKGQLRLLRIHGMRTRPTGHREQDGLWIQSGTEESPDCRTIMCLCDCDYSRRLHRERGHWLLRRLDEHGIGYDVTAGVVYSRQYPGRVLRLRMDRDTPMPGVPDQDQPVLAEFNTDDYDADDRAEFVEDRDDPYCLKTVNVEALPAA